VTHKRWERIKNGVRSIDESRHRKKIFKATSESTDRKKVNNRARKIHESEHKILKGTH